MHNLVHSTVLYCTYCTILHPHLAQSRRRVVPSSRKDQTTAFFNLNSISNTTTLSITKQRSPTHRPHHHHHHAAMPSASASPSPSPPPPAPTAHTPGPRAKQFIDVYELALSRTLAAIPYASFAACFPSIAAQAPAALRGMHGSMVARLQGFARDEFETILRERAVVERLNLLEEVIAEGRRRRAREVDGEGEGEGEGKGVV